LIAESDCSLYCDDMIGAAIRNLSNEDERASDEHYSELQLHHQLCCRSDFSGSGFSVWYGFDSRSFNISLAHI